MKKSAIALSILLCCSQYVYGEWVDTVSYGDMKIYIDRASVTRVDSHNPPYYEATIKMESPKDNTYGITTVYIYDTNAIESSKIKVFNSLNGSKIMDAPPDPISKIEPNSVDSKLYDRVKSIYSNQQTYIQNENRKKQEELRKQKEQEAIQGKFIGGLFLSLLTGGFWIIWHFGKKFIKRIRR